MRRWIANAGLISLLAVLALQGCSSGGKSKDLLTEITRSGKIDPTKDNLIRDTSGKVTMTLAIPAAALPAASVASLVIKDQSGITSAFEDANLDFALSKDSKVVAGAVVTLGQPGGSNFKIEKDLTLALPASALPASALPASALPAAVFNGGGQAALPASLTAAGAAASSLLKFQTDATKTEAKIISFYVVIGPKGNLKSDPIKGRLIYNDETDAIDALLSPDQFGKELEGGTRILVVFLLLEKKGATFSLAGVSYDDFADDFTGSLSDAFRGIADVIAKNLPPDPSDVKDALTVKEGEELRFDLKFKDENPGSVAIELVDAPSFVSLSNATLVISPGFSDAGTYNVRVSFTDKGNPPQTVEASVKIVVSNVNQQPRLIIDDIEVVEGETQTVVVNAVDTDDDQLTFTAKKVPSFGGFKGRTLTLKPKSGNAGTYKIDFTVADDGIPSLSDTKTMTVVVKKPEPTVVTTPKSLPRELTWQNPTPTALALRGSYAIDKDNAFFVGEAGTIYQFRNGFLIPMSSPVQKNLNAVWGYDTSHIWAVGDAGTILFYDGATWEKISTTHTGDLLSIAGFKTSSSVDVFAGSSTGKILALNSTSVLGDSAMDTGKTAPIRGLWGTSASNFYAVGGKDVSGDDERFLLHYTKSSGNNLMLVGAGGIFTEDLGFPDAPNSGDGVPNAIFGIGNRLFIAGGNDLIVYRDGSSDWTALPVFSYDEVPEPRDFFAVGSADDNLYVGGRGGIFSMPFSSFESSPTLYPHQAGMFDIFAVNTSGGDDTFFGVGASGEVVRSAPGDSYFDSFCNSLFSSPSNLKAIFGPSPNTIFVGGQNGDAAVFLSDASHDGWFTKFPPDNFSMEQSYLVQPSPVFDTTADITSIGKYAGATLFATGTDDTIFRLANGAWEPLDTSTDGIDFYDGWALNSTTTLFVGSAGKMLKFNGTSFSNTSSGSSKTLRAIWGADTNTIYVVGNEGTVLKSNNGGTSFSAVTTGATSATHFYDIWGTSTSNIYIVGENRALFHFDGTSWKSQGAALTMASASADLRGISGTSADDIYIAGSEGTALHYNGQSWARIPGNIANLNLFSVWAQSPLNIYFTGERNAILHYGIETLLTSTPQTLTAKVSGNNDPSFAVLANDELATFECYLSKEFASATYKTCAALASYKDLDDGLYYFKVRAKTKDGIVDLSPASFRWFIDTEPPVLEWTTTIPSTLRDTSATAQFTVTNDELLFDSSVAAVNFTCTLDDVALEYPVICGLGSSLSLTSLTQGTHTLEVTATDYAGNTSSISTTFFVSKLMQSWLLPTPAGATIRDMDGSDDTDMWAVGDAGLVMHNNGSGWLHVSVDPKVEFFAVTQFGANKALAVGKGPGVYSAEGVLYRCSRSTQITCTAYKPSDYTVPTFYDVWAPSGSEAYVGAGSGKLYKFTGSNNSFTSMTLPSEVLSYWTIYGIHGTGPNEIYATTSYFGSSAIIRYNGSSWSLVTTLATDLRRLHVDSSTDITALALDGSNPEVSGLMYHFRNNEWTPESSAESGKFTSITSPYAGRKYITTSAGAIYVVDGTDDAIETWSTSWLEQGSLPLYASWRDHAAGEHGFMADPDVEGWEPQILNFFGSDFVYNDIWSAIDPTGDVSVLVGENRITSRITGIWETTTDITTDVYIPNNLRTVHGLTRNFIWAAGEGGLVLFFNGQEWNDITGLTADCNGQGNAINDVFALDPQHVYFVGEAGVAFMFDGLGCSPISTDTTNNLLGVHARSASNIAIVGETDYAALFNGEAISPLPVTQGSNTWRRVFILPNDDVLIAGTDYNGYTPYFSRWNGSSFVDNHPSSFYGSPSDLLYAGSSEIYLTLNGNTYGYAPLIMFDGSTWRALPIIYGSAEFNVDATLTAIAKISSQLRITGTPNGLIRAQWSTP